MHALGGAGGARCGLLEWLVLSVSSLPLDDVVALLAEAIREVEVVDLFAERVVLVGARRDVRRLVGVRRRSAARRHVWVMKRKRTVETRPRVREEYDDWRPGEREYD